ncbi:LolA family protein [Streptomyces lycii]|uniref:DUF2092 domain-containing protein n=1 Tax=Streptomyces lycii TaxID=2654337 RepID=A0ABQ7FCH4_9ACTN|nr:DUF2092 domain-containing protein [Streptomyces lycii]KAF4406277.1 DUF2092 domain-containing protein [Streptomyces lycii]
MPGKRPTQVTDEWNGGGSTPAPGRRAARYAVPVAVAGVAAATIGLVPALASTGSPDLPEISAAELIAKMAESDTEQLSGTVKVSTDLGLPGLPGLSGGGQGGQGLFGGGHGGSGPDGGRGVDGSRGAEDGRDGEGGEGKGSAADPQAKLMELASGTHTLRVAADGPDRQRLSIVGDAAEYSLIHNGDELWAYDSGSNSAFHATAPDDSEKKRGDGGKHQPGGLPGELADATPQELAEHALKAVDDTTTVKVDGTAKVAGRDAYQLAIEPKAEESTVESVRIAVDADNGVPLKFTLHPKSGGKAAIDVGFTSVDFGAPDAKLFEFTPPKGAEVTEADERRPDGKQLEERLKEKGLDGKGLDEKSLRELREKSGGGGLSGLNVIGEGWASVAELRAPDGGKGLGGTGAGGELPARAEQFLDSLGEKVSGDFGGGRVFSTRLVNVLMTDDGAVYAGAVDKAALVEAAEEAK